jgi:uroporphyrinogen decarboxylase
MEIMMNRREIFTAAMNHQEVGRVLVDQGKQVGSIHKYGYAKIREIMGLPPKEGVILDRMSQCVISDEDLLEAWGIDFRWLIPNWVQIEEIDADHYRNLFGVLFRNSGDYFSVYDAPLREKELADIGTYPWPNLNDPAMFAGLRERAQDLQENSDYVIGADGIKGGILQTSLELRGYDQLYMDFYLEPEFANALLDKVTDCYKQMYTNYMREVGEYVQIVYLTDDFGSQNSMLMSKDMWETFMKPRQADLIAHIKSLAPHVKVMFHTDGSVLPIIDGMIEMGVDILNPVQTSVEELKDTRALNELHGDNIAFHGAIDVQNIMVNATPDQIREEVNLRLCDLGKGGGYIIATCHNIGYDIPPENLKAFYAAVQEFSAYPLKRLGD